jgi:hypothetical protein
MAGSDGHAVRFRQRYGTLSAGFDGLITVGVVNGSSGKPGPFPPAGVPKQCNLGAQIEAPTTTNQFKACRRARVHSSISHYPDNGMAVLRSTCAKLGTTHALSVAPCALRSVNSSTDRPCGGHAFSLSLPTARSGPVAPGRASPLDLDPEGSAVSGGPPVHPHLPPEAPPQPKRVLNRYTETVLRPLDPRCGPSILSLLFHYE